MTCVNESKLRTPTEVTVATEIRLKRSHTRTGLGDDLLMVNRRGVKSVASGLWLDGRTRHELATPEDPDSVEAQVRTCVDHLVGLGVPRGLGRDKLRDWARLRGVSLPGKTTTLGLVVGALKADRDA